MEKFIVEVYFEGQEPIIKEFWHYYGATDYACYMKIVKGAKEVRVIEENKKTCQKPLINEDYCAII